MKQAYLGLCILILSVGLWSCRNTMVPWTQSGNWVLRAFFGGNNRSEAVSFTIGNFAYLAGGWDGTNRYNDMWQLDPSGDGGAGVWSQLASMPATNRLGGGTARSSAVGFSVNGIGYIGTGYDGFNYMNDFWAFDPLADSFIQKADFAGGPRYEAAAFGIGNFGYITTGYDGVNPLKDFWRYDPSTDTWIVKSGMGGEKRFSAVTFVRLNKAYIVTGCDNGSAVNDFWRYDPAQADSSAWTQLNHITNFSTESFDDSYTTIIRWNAAAFVILGQDTTADRAFISTGENGSLYTYTWEYHFTADLWDEKTPFEGAARTGAVGITVQNRGFVGTGRSSLQPLQDIEEFLPDEIENPND
jgi:N-acetylneuraminic acid mutarotase